MLKLHRKNGQSVALFREGEDTPFMEIRAEIGRNNGQMKLIFFGGEEIRIIRTELLQKQPQKSA